MLKRGIAFAVALAGAFTLPSIAIAPTAVIERAARRGHRRPPIAIYRTAPRLNRSRRWAFAESYGDARRISPCPHIPVR